MRQILFSGSAEKLHESARRLFLTEKPVPVLSSLSEDRQHYALGTLSHIVNDSVPGYQPLPDYPEVFIHFVN